MFALMCNHINEENCCYLLYGLYLALLLRETEILGRCHIVHEQTTAQENILPERRMEMLLRPTAVCLMKCIT